MLGFLPKVPSNFHLNQEIILPTFRAEDDRRVHRLDVADTLKAYLAATSDCRRSDPLFVIPAGVRKGLPASRRLLASWLVKTISLAYSSKHLPVTEGISAHSTRSVSTSWAAVRNVSLETICKAATWSSEHTLFPIIGLNLPR